MQNLHSVLLWYPGKRKAERMMETPTKTQEKTLEAFCWEINRDGILQVVWRNWFSIKRLGASTGLIPETAVKEGGPLDILMGMSILQPSFPQ